jgi:hypothetical protein
MNTGNSNPKAAMLIICSVLGFFISSHAQNSKSKNILNRGDSVYLVIFFELNEDRYKSLHHLKSLDSLPIEATIRERIAKVLGRRLVLIPLNKNCLSNLYPDSLELRNQQRLFEILAGCSVDRIMTVGVVWRYKSHAYYREEQRAHKRTTNNGVEINTLGLVGQTYLTNVAILSMNDRVVFYQKNQKLEKDLEGAPTMNNLRFTVPFIVRRSMNPIKRIIK